MTDEEQRAARRQALASEESEEGFLPLGVEGRGRFVGNDDLRASDQRARRRYALLLADAQARDALSVQRLLKIKVGQQARSLVVQRATGRQSRARVGAPRSGTTGERYRLTER
jgi:hypothetical protein